jgi:hypothetical protein
MKSRPILLLLVAGCARTGDLPRNPCHLPLDYPERCVAGAVGRLGRVDDGVAGVLATSCRVGAEDVRRYLTSSGWEWSGGAWVAPR